MACATASSQVPWASWPRLCLCVAGILVEKLKSKLTTLSPSLKEPCFLIPSLTICHGPLVWVNLIVTSSVTSVVFFSEHVFCLTPLLHGLGRPGPWRHSPRHSFEGKTLGDALALSPPLGESQLEVGAHGDSAVKKLAQRAEPRISDLPLSAPLMLVQVLWRHARQCRTSESRSDFPICVLVLCVSGCSFKLCFPQLVHKPRPPSAYPFGRPAFTLLAVRKV